MISFEVQDLDGSIRMVEVPEEISLSLMEVLKASEYPIKATCHVEVLSEAEDIGSPGDAELDMIDTLPNASVNSRLACQIRLSEQLNGARFLLKEGE